MEKKKFKELSPGDIVRHKLFGDNAYIVHSNYGDRVVAVRTVELTNPDEWDLILKCDHKKA